MITACFFAGISAFFSCFESTQHSPWAWSTAPLPLAAEWQPSVSLWAELPVKKTLLSLVIYFCFAPFMLIHYNKTPCSIENYNLLRFQLLLSWIWAQLLFFLLCNHILAIRCCVFFKHTQQWQDVSIHSICSYPTAWINLQAFTAQPAIFF